MFERFTASARRTIFFAAVEAESRGSSAISPGDLLIGLTQYRADAPSDGLLNGREDEVRVTLGRQPRTRELTAALARNQPLDDDGKRVLALAEREANRERSYAIDKDHLLLAILRNGGSAAATVNGMDHTLPGVRKYWRQEQAKNKKNRREQRQLWWRWYWQRSLYRLQCRFHRILFVLGRRPHW